MKKISEIEDEFNQNDSDNETYEAEHSKLLSAVRQLDDKQRVKPPTRKESSRQVSEFDLGKHQIKNVNVGVQDLTKSLEKRASHVEIGQKLKLLKKQAKTLRKPLEKHESEKIKRTVGFTNVKKQLSRWSAVVHRNRVVEGLTFPLIPKGTITLDTTKDFLNRFETKSELETRISEILNNSKTVQEEREAAEEEFPLSLEEIIEKRKEMAKLRAQQSYREAKAHRQKKIKSKSYHRTLRRQRIKQQLKEFETLQKTDPEAALKQLDQIERARAEERMTLRHRNTSQWARSRAVRAKYNEQTRRELAEQLAISRDLTQKVQVDESSSDEAVDETNDLESQVRSDNPWVSEKVESEINSFMRGYLEYWEKNNLSQKSNKDEHVSEQSDLTVNGVIASTETVVLNRDQNKINSENTSSQIQTMEIPKSIDNEDNVANSNSHDGEEKNSQLKRKKQAKNISMKKRKLRTRILSFRQSSDVIVTSGAWEVTDISAKADEDLKCSSLDDKNENKTSSEIICAEHKPRNCNIPVDDLFDKMERKLRASVTKKVEKYREDVLNNCNRNEVNAINSDDEIRHSLEMKNSLRHPEMDEELIIDPEHGKTSLDIRNLQKISNTLINENKIEEQRSDIDPKKFIAVKAKVLESALPDIGVMEEAIDEDDASTKLLTITEAFADDDVVEQFRKEKEEETKKSQPEDIDLSLPGWGSWGGKGILASVPKKKKKHFIIKFPKPAPRKDANKGDVIINEEKDVKVKEHQVSELPFPFTTVKDFEASVRAPVGSTWITQSAHRKLTTPKYKTKLGKIIKPMDEDLLLKKKP